MEVGFNSFIADQEDGENSPENSKDFPASTSSPNTRRGTKKRVVRVPIRAVEGSRLKNETNAPPSDSWAWRKYGQKPIKGSPYPRSYYRCSSSKGCPARKQVERSRIDPTTVVVTYSCNHNHPWPASRNNHHRNSTASPPAASTAIIITTVVSDTDDQVKDPSISKIKTERETDEKFTSLEVGPGGTFVGPNDQYEWFSDLESTSSTILESPIMARDINEDAEMAMVFSIREDEDSFFADLDELPECTMVFRRREIERVEEHHRRQCNLAS